VSDSQPALLRTAFELPAQQRAAIQAALDEAFGQAIPLEFEIAPELISGIKLGAQGQKLAWSIADYLDELASGINALVDAKDPAFDKPTKFVGPVYEREEAETRAKAAGWSIAADGDKWRRVVASPKPLEIPDLRVLQLLLDQDVIVICTGGGGIPVMRHANGSLSGVEAVIDKDAASALLAQQLKADALLLLTDVDAVYRDFGTDSQSPIDELAFAEQGGMAGIGRLADAVQILAGSAGTRIKG
jgi:carbamate kinase